MSEYLLNTTLTSHESGQKEFDLEHNERPEGMSFLKHMIAGSLAGVAEHCLVYPVDTIKTYM